MKKRILSIVLCLCMILGLSSSIASASETSSISSTEMPKNLVNQSSESQETTPSTSDQSLDQFPDSVEPFVESASKNTEEAEEELTTQKQSDTELKTDNIDEAENKISVCQDEISVNTLPADETVMPDEPDSVIEETNSEAETSHSEEDASSSQAIYDQTPKLVFFGDYIIRDQDGNVSEERTAISQYVEEFYNAECDDYSHVGIGWYKNGEHGLKAYDAIAKADLSQYDYAVIAIGDNDADQPEHYGTINDANDTETVMGQFHKCIQYIKQQNPNISIILIAPWPEPSTDEADITALLSEGAAMYDIPFITHEDNPVDAGSYAFDENSSSQTAYAVYIEWITGKLKDIIGFKNKTENDPEPEVLMDSGILKRSIAEGTIKLPQYSYTYTGDVINPVPSVTITINNKPTTLTNGTDYKVSYKDNKSIGTATVIVEGIGNYKNAISKTFTIVPAIPEKLTITDNKTSLKGTWEKTEGSSGYHVQFCDNPEFPSGQVKTRARKGSDTTYVDEAMDKNGKYYVRVRSYKVVDGTYYYSDWSDAVEVYQGERLLSNLAVGNLSTNTPSSNNLGPKFKTEKTITRSGIRYKWNGERYLIKGTATGPSYYNLYADQTKLPAYIIPGRTYYIKNSITCANIYFRFIWFLSDGTKVQRAFNYKTKQAFYTVPDNAVGMYMRYNVNTGKTVNGGARLPEIYLCNVSDPENLLPAIVTKKDSTKSGVKYSWYGDGCVVKGTASAPSYNDMYDQRTALPKGLIPGERYYASSEITGSNIYFRMIWRLSDGTIVQDSFYKNKNSGYFTVPKKAIGVTIRLNVNTGRTANGIVSNLSIRRVPAGEQSPVCRGLAYSWWVTNRTQGSDGTQYFTYISTEAMAGVACRLPDGTISRQNLYQASSNDDHNAPGICMVTVNGKQHVCVVGSTGHNASRKIHVYLATKPNTIQCHFEDRTSSMSCPEGYYYANCYAQVFVSNNVIYDIFRVKQARSDEGKLDGICWVCAKSNDLGKSWEINRLVRMESTLDYLWLADVKGSSTLKRIILQRNTAASPLLPIREGFVDLASGTVYDANMNDIGKPMQTVSDTDLIFDKSVTCAEYGDFTNIIPEKSGYRIRLLDVWNSDSSRTEFLYARMASKNNRTDFILYKYDEGKSIEIAHLGRPFYNKSLYVTGACFAGDSDTIIYSKNNSDTADGRHSLHIAKLSDGKVISDTVCAQSSELIARPARFPDGRIIYLSGRYNESSGSAFASWDLSTVFLP